MPSLFTNTYSGLITKGLGLPACCGMITMAFSLFVCTVNVTPVPPAPGGGGGGGSYAVFPDIYKPYEGTARKEKRIVTISVKFNDKFTWRQAYTLSMQKASVVVKAIDIVNAATHKMSVAVTGLKRASRGVFARFR